MNVQINKSILAVVFCWGLSLSALTQAGTYSGGGGTEANPYQISAVNDWMELIGTSADWKKHFILTADLDFGGVAITPVARDTNPSSSGFQGTAFTGVFDGGGHVLRNFVINRPARDYVGLFGQVGSGGQVRNLGVEPLRVTGRLYVGGLCGYNKEGTITSCYATGAVNGYWNVGGLCGENYSSGKITSCYATGAVSGTESVGGLCGVNWSTISGSFWDIQTSGMTTSAGGTGKTTAEMQTLSTFTSAGWDFSTVWKMLRENEDYPRLIWQEEFAGDIAGLYGVDLIDLSYLSRHWGLVDCGGADDCGRADIDSSGDVGIGDLLHIANDWLKR